MDFEIVKFMEKYVELVNEVRSHLIQISKNTGKEFDIDRLDSIESDPERTLKIVFVGQYSAGKSSIIKMLTENKDIAIGAAITTQEYTPYKWKGIDIIDTPGVQTGLREDHDAITEKAIKEADLVVFVITNELFNNTLINYFRKLAYDMGKAGQMLLVINKMDRGGEEKILYEDLSKVLNMSYKEYTIKPIETFRPCFVNAESYLEAKNEVDENFKAELIEISNRDKFIEALNNFAENKGLLGKLLKPIRDIEEILNDATMILSDNENEQNEMSTFRAEIENIREVKTEHIRNLEDAFLDIAAEIRACGEELANEVQVDTTEESLKNKQKETNEQLERLKIDLQRKIEDESEAVREYVSNFINKQIEINPELNINMSNNATKMNKFVEMGGKHLFDGSRGVSEEILKMVGNQIYKNKFFFKQTAINNFIGSYSGILSRGIAAIGVLASVYTKYQEEEKNKQIEKIRNEIVTDFIKLSRQVKQNGRTEYTEPLSREFEKLIKSKYKELDKSNNLIEEYRQGKKDVDLLMEQCKSLSDFLIDN